MKVGYYNSPFGRSCLAFSEAGLAALTFAETDTLAVSDLQRRFPEENFEWDYEQAERLGYQVFNNPSHVRIDARGTPFQQSVWNALIDIPRGETRTYQQIADAIGRSKSVRAVATAIGANHIAWLIPCHRVLRTDGHIGGYRWGVAIKTQMLQLEGVTQLKL